VALQATEEGLYDAFEKLKAGRLVVMVYLDIEITYFDVICRCIWKWPFFQGGKIDIFTFNFVGIILNYEIININANIV